MNDLVEGLHRSPNGSIETGIGKYEILSSGGGTQSACIIALVIQERLPRPDGIAIVDTEREHPAVWIYHNEVIVPNLEKAGLVIHRITKSDYATVDLWAKG